MSNVRRLVERIAQILGPDASPERVEAIAVAALNALEGGAPSDPFQTPEPGERALITCYGQDHPGILSAVTQTVSDAGCNILDVSQKILQGYFTLIMLADISKMRGSIRDLQRQLDTVGQRLHVRAMVQHEDLFNAMHRP